MQPAPDVLLTVPQQQERHRLRWVSSLLIFFSVVSCASVLHLIVPPVDSILGVVTGSLTIHWSCYNYNMNQMLSKPHKFCGFGHVYGLALSTLVFSIVLNIIRLVLLFGSNIELISLFALSSICSLLMMVCSAYITSSTSPTSCCLGSCLTNPSRRLHVANSSTGQRNYVCGRISCFVLFFVCLGLIVALAIWAASKYNYVFGSNYYRDLCRDYYYSRRHSYTSYYYAC